MGGGKRILLIIFNLIYCTYLGRGLGRWRGERVPSFCPSHSFSTAMCLCLPPAHTTPLPLLSGCGSIFYRSPLPSSLSLTPPLPPPLQPVVSCSFLGFCTTQLVYTVYTQPAKRKPDGKHLMVRLEWLCPAASRRRPWGDTGRGSGTGVWLFWSPGWWLRRALCICYVSLCNKRAPSQNLVT